jgi:hypothetical protein
MTNLGVRRKSEESNCPERYLIRQTLSSHLLVSSPTYLRYELTFKLDNYEKKQSIMTRVRPRVLAIKSSKAIHARLDPLVRLRKYICAFH